MVAVEPPGDRTPWPASGLAVSRSGWCPVRHLMIVLREYEDFCNRHRPHRILNQAAPLRPLPDSVTDLGQFRVQRRDRARGVIHEYRPVA